LQISERRFFRDFGIFELLTAPLGKSSESKETRKVTTLSLHPPPTGILFFTKKPGILASTTLERNRPTFNSHTDAIGVSWWLDFIRSLLVLSAWAAADSTAPSTLSIDRTLLNRWPHLRSWLAVE
jgi:hypothetical protein